MYYTLISSVFLDIDSPSSLLYNCEVIDDTNSFIFSLIAKYFAKTGAEYIGLVDTIEFEKTK